MQPNTVPIEGRPVEAPVITHLEMTSAAALKPKPSADPDFRVEPVGVPCWQYNRHFYRSVGEPWAWNDKRGWSDDQWRAYVTSGRLWTHVAYRGREPVGYHELRWDDSGGIEIAYLGLLPGTYGRGWGAGLLTQALEEAWRRRPTRVWVHTCTWDHPAALRNYLARGLSIYDPKRRAS